MAEITNTIFFFLFSKPKDYTIKIYEIMISYKSEKKEMETQSGSE